jgi:hypothetical protein
MDGEKSVLGVHGFKVEVEIKESHTPNPPFLPLPRTRSGPSHTLPYTHTR